MTPFVDVLVVGGGPAGLAAAHAVTVARPALKVAVCERSDLRPRGAIVFLPPNGVRAIEAIRPSLKPALARHHTTHMKVRSFTPTGELKMSADDGGIMAKMAALDGGERITIPWHTLQRELADALPPGMVHTHHRFLGYTETADGVLAELATADGEVKRVETKVLVGCDGGQSMVREQLLGDGPPKYLGLAIWRAVRPRPADWPVDEGGVSFGAPGQASALTHTIGGAGDMMAFQAFAPWPEDQLHVIGGGRQAYIQDAAVGPAAGSKGEERLQRALAAFDSYPKALKDLIATTSPSAVAEHGQFSRDVEQCQVYSKGRVALTGDAAHLATPFLGQGCSQALEDALELGRAIGVHGATPEALAAYASVRVPLASAVQAASLALFRDFMQGKQGKSEFEINSEMGFTKRTFDPLAPAQAAPASAPA